MARIPSKFDLSSPGSFRSGRPIASYDTSGIARGVQQLGQSLEGIGEDMHRDEMTTSIIGADGPATKERHDLFQSLSQDGDYNTYEDRYSKGTAAIKSKYASTITDLKARQQWEADFDRSAEADRVRLQGLSSSKVREDRLVIAKNGLNSYKQIIADDTVTEDERQKAKASADASIAALQQEGVLDPSEADQWRTNVVKGGDFVLGQRMIQREGGKALGGHDQVDKIIGVESGGDPNAKNPNSSAEGPGQFIDSTWLSMVRKYRPDIAAGKSAPELLALKTDNALSREMTGKYRDENSQFLTNQGIAATDGNIYLAHFLGPRGAAQVLKADPNAPVADIVGQDVVNANKFLAGKSAADLRAWADKKMGSASSPSWYTSQTPEDQYRLDQNADSRDRELRVERRGEIDNVIQSAPSAVQYTGTYSGQIPTREQFILAYGADGNDRYKAFEASMDVAHQVYNFTTMPESEIQSAVMAARPSSSGEDAGLQVKRYEALSQAASQTIAARKADPAAYTSQAFPAVRKAWEQGIANQDYQTAFTAMAAAQTALGIKDMKLLPDRVADTAVAGFKNAETPGVDRLKAVAGVVFATSDKTQRRTVFKQLVDAGLPPTMEGAFEAMARGDQGAATRLMDAAVADPKQLPDSDVVKPAVINDAIYSRIWAPGSIGYAAYGLSFSDASSLERAQRATELVSKETRLRIARGEDMDTAVDNVAKDLFGHKVVFNGGGKVNADLAVDNGDNQTDLQFGLLAVRDSFEKALSDQRGRVLRKDDFATDKNLRTILEYATENRKNDILENGIFVGIDGGIGLMDPYTGQLVADDADKPLTLSYDSIMAKGRDRTSEMPDTNLDETFNGPVLFGDRPPKRTLNDMKRMAEPQQ